MPELTDPDNDGILEFTQTVEDVDGDSVSITGELDQVNGTTQSGSDRNPSWFSFTTSSTLSAGTRTVDVDIQINASELGGAGTTYTFELYADDGVTTSTCVFTLTVEQAFKSAAAVYGVGDNDNSNLIEYIPSYKGGPVVNNVATLNLDGTPLAGTFEDGIFYWTEVSSGNFDARIKKYDLSQGTQTTIISDYGSVLSDIAYDKNRNEFIVGYNNADVAKRIDVNGNDVATILSSSEGSYKGLVGVHVPEDWAFVMTDDNYFRIKDFSGNVVEEIKIGSIPNSSSVERADYSPERGEILGYTNSDRHVIFDESLNVLSDYSADGDNPIGLHYDDNEDVVIQKDYQNNIIEKDLNGNTIYSEANIMRSNNFMQVKLA